MPAVEFRNIDIVFGRDRKAALRLLDQGHTPEEIRAATGAVIGAAGVSLAVERGDICVLMGLSGSGKSTILRAVNGLNEVTRGEMLVEHRGRSVDTSRCNAGTLRDIRLRTVSMVFQQFGLLPWRTVRDNVGLGLELRGDIAPATRRRIVDDNLAMVGLADWADKYTHELSGGMQQRVGLARAFATDADILLMDEPFSALDPLIRDRLQDELLGLQQRIQKTIIFVSHDPDEALKLGNRIAIMESGRIVQAGSPQEILLNPADDYVAEFVRHMNPLHALHGTAVMRPAGSLHRTGRLITLDTQGQASLLLDEKDSPLALTVEGSERRLVKADEQAGLASDMSRDDGAAIIAPAHLKLTALIALKRRTKWPLLLVDDGGRLLGLCGDDDIYRGLLSHHDRGS